MHLAPGDEVSVNPIHVGKYQTAENWKNRLRPLSLKTLILYIETFNNQSFTHQNHHIMNTFFKAMTVAIDILLAITLGLEIKDRLDARKKNMSNDNDTVVDPEPVTTE